MGQHYNVVIKNKNTIIAYNREVDGKYTMAKLTEHSWWYNPFVSSITKLLYKNPCKVAWIGDYSETECAEEINPILFEFAWGDEVEKHSIHQDEIYLDGKYLVNHTIGAYLDCDKYKARCNNNDWILHPLPLLTAVGNGLGGGDYYGINKDQVGGWAWCTISVEDDIPVGYEELEYIFRED